MFRNRLQTEEKQFSFLLFKRNHLSIQREKESVQQPPLQIEIMYLLGCFRTNGHIILRANKICCNKKETSNLNCECQLFDVSEFASACAPPPRTDYLFKLNIASSHEIESKEGVNRRKQRPCGSRNVNDVIMIFTRQTT